MDVEVVRPGTFRSLVPSPEADQRRATYASRRYSTSMRGIVIGKWSENPLVTRRFELSPLRLGSGRRRPRSWGPPS
jgi:hypothetical protein